jgi:hypothetical protein
VGSPSSSGSSSQDSAPYLGAELSYSRELGRRGRWHYGFEVAANYMSFSMQDNTSSSSTTTHTADTYPFTAGTTPPAATPANPYQGSYEGPGFLIGATPVNSTTNFITTTTINGRQFDADIWGFRLGPYLGTSLGTNLDLYASGGLAVGLVSCSMSWKQTVSDTGGGSTTTTASATDLTAQWGFYVGADACWRFSDRWSAMGGVQYQNLGKYQHSFSGQTVELDLSKSIFVSLGLSYNF